MHRLLIQERTPGSPVTVDRPFVETDGYRTMMGAKTQVIAILQSRRGVIGLTKLACALDNGLENRPDVGWRRGDHAEDVAAAGLVSQSFGKLAGLGLNLVEQPHVL